jgi:hypothetical protein
MPLRQPRLNLPDLGLRIVQLRHDEPQDRPRQFRQASFVLFDRCDQAFDMAQPCGATMPNSARWARSALTAIVR